MERNREQQKSMGQLSFSEQLTQHIASEGFDIAEMFDRASASYPRNRRKQHLRTALAVAIGFVLGALAMYFFPSPERWIRL